MKEVFLIIATVLTVVCVIPYLIDILKGKSKPNLVSWVTWTLLTLIATAAAFSSGEFVAAIFTGAAALETGLVVVFGLLKHSYVKYSSFDVICQISAIVGIILWQVFDSPEIAVIASVTIDLIGALPTIRHSYQKPDEETWVTYALAALGGVFGLLALETYNLINTPYVFYVVIINTALVAVILLPKRQKVTQK
jgi:hypothetical protein